MPASAKTGMKYCSKFGRYQLSAPQFVTGHYEGVCSGKKVTGEVSLAEKCYQVRV